MKTIASSFPSSLPLLFSSIAILLMMAFYVPPCSAMKGIVGPSLQQSIPTAVRSDKPGLGAKFGGNTLANGKLKAASSLSFKSVGHYQGIAADGPNRGITDVEKARMHAALGEGISHPLDAEEEVGSGNGAIGVNNNGNISKTYAEDAPGQLENVPDKTAEEKRQEYEQTYYTHPKNATPRQLENVPVESAEEKRQKYEQTYYKHPKNGAAPSKETVARKLLDRLTPLYRPHGLEHLLGHSVAMENREHILRETAELLATKGEGSAKLDGNIANAVAYAEALATRQYIRSKQLTIIILDTLWEQKKLKDPAHAKNHGKEFKLTREEMDDLLGHYGRDKREAVDKMKEDFAAILGMEKGQFDGDAKLVANLVAERVAALKKELAKSAPLLQSLNKAVDVVSGPNDVPKEATDARAEFDRTDKLLDHVKLLVETFDYFHEMPHQNHSDQNPVDVHQQNAAADEKPHHQLQHHEDKNKQNKAAVATMRGA